MTELELADQILLICYQYRKPVHIKKCLREKDHLDENAESFKINFPKAIETLKYHELIKEHDATIAQDLFITISGKGNSVIKDHGSLSSWLKSKKKVANKRKRGKNLTIIKATLSALIVALMSILSYFQDETIKTQQKQTNQPQQKVDSLSSSNNTL